MRSCKTCTHIMSSDKKYCQINPEVTRHIRKASRNGTKHQVNIFPSPSLLLCHKTSSRIRIKISNKTLIYFGHFCRQTNPAKGRYDTLAVPGRCLDSGIKQAWYQMVSSHFPIILDLAEHGCQESINFFYSSIAS